MAGHRQTMQAEERVGNDYYSVRKSRRLLIERESERVCYGSCRSEGNRQSAALYLAAVAY